MNEAERETLLTSIYKKLADYIYPVGFCGGSCITTVFPKSTKLGLGVATVTGPRRVLVKLNDGNWFYVLNGYDLVEVSEKMLNQIYEFDILNSYGLGKNYGHLLTEDEKLAFATIATPTNNNNNLQVELTTENPMSTNNQMTKDEMAELLWRYKWNGHYSQEECNLLINHKVGTHQLLKERRALHAQASSDFERPEPINFPTLPNVAIPGSMVEVSEDVIYWNMPPFYLDPLSDCLRWDRSDSGKAKELSNKVTIPPDIIWGSRPDSVSFTVLVTNVDFFWKHNFHIVELNDHHYPIFYVDGKIYWGTGLLETTKSPEKAPVKEPEPIIAEENVRLQKIAEILLRCKLEAEYTSIECELIKRFWSKDYLTSNRRTPGWFQFDFSTSERIPVPGSLVAHPDLLTYADKFYFDGENLRWDWSDKAVAKEHGDLVGYPHAYPGAISTHHRLEKLDRYNLVVDGVHHFFGLFDGTYLPVYWDDVHKVTRFGIGENLKKMQEEAPSPSQIVAEAARSEVYEEKSPPKESAQPVSTELATPKDNSLVNSPLTSAQLSGILHIHCPKLEQRNQRLYRITKLRFPFVRSKTEDIGRFDCDNIYVPDDDWRAKIAEAIQNGGYKIFEKYKCLMVYKKV